MLDAFFSLLGSLARAQIGLAETLEAPLSKDRGFTLTVRQLFQGAKPPKRHRPYKVCAADLLIRWSAPEGASNTGDHQCRT